MATLLSTDNPQVPGFTSELYQPDQLIAGRFPLVTEQNILLTGGLLLPRGAVLGKITEGAVATVAGLPASGTITFSAQPAVGDTIVLNGTSIAFIANGAVPAAGQVALGLTQTATIENLMAYLIASTDVQLVKFKYSAAGNVITLTAATGGTGGNALTVVENSAATVASGATLAGGTANTGNPTFGAIARGPNYQLGGYKVTMLTATTFSVLSPSGTALPNGSTGVPYVNNHLSFTLTAGGTPAVAGDSFIIQAAPGSGSYALCNAAAVDGSQVPSGILADVTDATLGDVNAGIYITGEFNQNALFFDPSWTIATLKSALRASSIFVRSVVSAAPPN
jgi:hypothetical protein